ncbi:hypothetical protein XENOCAPTIV_030934 [Xenoophorus captivus]|uniref:Uncharacterized protein n=1 Tax=Xenoophorus captivus TaxID=1517983 RepID=A0ABV0RGF3_9TELE
MPPGRYILYKLLALFSKCYLLLVKFCGTRRALFKMANNLAALCQYIGKPTTIEADRDGPLEKVSIAGESFTKISSLFFFSPSYILTILVVSVYLNGSLYNGSLDAVCNTSVNPSSSTIFIGLQFNAIHLARTFVSLSVADLLIRGVFSSTLVWRRALLWLAKLLMSSLLTLTVAAALATGCFALMW